MNRSIHSLSKIIQGAILVVDDDAPFRELIGRWSREAGFECYFASSVEEAQSQVNRLPIDVITLNIEIPGPPAREWLPLFRASHPDIQVIMLAAWEDIDASIQALSYGATACLLKPVDRKSFIAEVERAKLSIETANRHRDYVAQLERNLREQKQLTDEIANDVLERLLAASMINDDEDIGHVRRIGMMSSIVASQMHLGLDYVEQIRQAAPLHDVGKVAVPENILRKPGKLTSDEFEVVKSHTTIGALILTGGKLPVLRMAELIALHLHERWDGKGYPSALSKQEIPLAARIVAVADAYDAMTHDRVYRRALSNDVAIAELKRNAGVMFDPEVVSTFLAALPRIATGAESISHDNRCRVLAPLNHEFDSQIFAQK